MAEVVMAGVGSGSPDDPNPKILRDKIFGYLIWARGSCVYFKLSMPDLRCRFLD